METLFKKFNIISTFKKTEFSAVYLADHIHLEKRIILKTLDSVKAVDSTDPARFKREAQIMAKLNHPNIIRVLDFGTFENYVYISFEYFPAQTMREIINLNKMSASQKINLLQQAANGLAYAHRNNVVHRDIKPENILVDDEYLLKIADFGLALSAESSNLTNPESIMGTPAYMSPEQISGTDVRPASDLFSLGLIAYELFNKNNPLLGADIGQTVNNIMNFNSSKHNELLSKINETEKSIIKNLLDPDPLKRKIPTELIKDEDYTIQTKRSNFASKIIWSGVSLILLVVIFIIYDYSFNSEEVKEESKGREQNQQITKSAPLLVDNSQIQSIENNNSIPITDKAQPTEPVSEIQARLKIESIPPALIFINSEPSGNTANEATIDLQAGFYHILLKNEDFPDYQQNIELKTGEQTQFTINFKEHSGLLKIFAFPWAEVTINGENYGQTPLEKPLRLKNGLYRLELRNPAFEIYKTTFEINGNDTILVQHNFNKRGFGTKIE